MKYSLLFFLSLPLLVFAQTASQDSSNLQREYAWPTNASRLLSSSFAESRSGRFHAGIDFKTWGQIGYELFAIRDGYISRIRVSPFGYGRCIYLKLDNGEEVVYGHMSKFSEAVEAFVKAEQKKRNSFDLQLFPKSSQFPVKKGEVIGYSGDTGVGYPHLHFEMRDAYSNPINPLGKGYNVKDNVAPTITKFLAQPLDAFSTVNRDFRPVTATPVYMGNSHFHIQEKLTVTGRVSFGVEAFDMMDDVTNKFGTYENELYIDGEKVFRAVYEKFSYATNNHFVLDRNFRQYAWGKGYIYNLFRDFENKLSFYSSKQDYYGVLNFASTEPLPVSFNGELKASALVEIPPAVKDIAAGEHQLEIVCKDYWGNTSRLTATLLVPKSVYFSSPSDSLLWDTVSGATELLDRDYIIADSAHINLNSQFAVATSFYDRYARILLRSQDANIQTPVVSGWSHIGKNIKMPLIKKGNGLFVGAWPLSDQVVGPISLKITFQDKFGNQFNQDEWLNFTTIPKGQSKTFQTDDGLCKLDFSASSLFKDFFIHAQIDTTTKLLGYDIMSAFYKLQPADLPMRDGCTLYLQYPASDSLFNKLGIYYRNSNSLVFMGNRINSQTHTVSAHIGGLGSFCLAHDVEPPRIMSLSPANGARYNHKTPRLYATFRDALSGISGEQNRVLKLDGKKVIAEYDPEKLLLFYEPDEELSSGQHTVEIFVKDQCGNVNTLSHEFWIN